MEKLYFNTGVKPWNGDKLGEHEEFINGEKHVAFYVDDIPKNGIFEFACPESTFERVKKDYPYYEFRKIIDGGLCSDYAAFKIIGYNVSDY
jgi:hypothetical protein